MAEVAPTSFENLTQSGLVRINSKDDRNVSLSIDVYMGNTSLVIFTGAGGKPWKLGLPSKTQSQIVMLFKKMRANPGTIREPMFLKEFVEADGKRKFQEKGCVGFGVDENLVPYIDVVANDLNGRHVFPIKGDGRFDFSNTSLSEKDMLIATLDFLIQTFSISIPMAERISSFKRTGGSGGGGNRGGGSYSGAGGNRGNYSGGGSGGGNSNYGNQSRQNSQQQSSTFSGGPDAENDLHV